MFWGFFLATLWFKNDISQKKSIDEMWKMRRPFEFELCV